MGLKTLLLWGWVAFWPMALDAHAPQRQMANLHPLRLSLCEVDYQAPERKVRVALKLFLMDIEDALLLDQGVENQRFCTPQEDPKANQFLLQYLNRYFAIEINGQKMPLKIKEKKLKGEGDNEALWCLFEFSGIGQVRSLSITNKVFTELFYDQSNIIYVHVGEDSRSLMLNIETPSHRLVF